MQSLTDAETSGLAESLTIYATLRLWGLFTSYRRDSLDGEILWEQNFAAWKDDYLREITVLRSICVKLNAERECLQALDEALAVMGAADQYKDLTERQMQRRMKKWQSTLSGRLRGHL